jgi:hypothetical protein
LETLSELGTDEEEDGFTSLENASAASKGKQHTVHGKKAHASSIRKIQPNGARPCSLVDWMASDLVESYVFASRFG